ncbi:MAG: PRC-barrel domain-containing protein [Candidatus Dormibacteraeota bacterium]|nr:PRC-barrel domain-containing protein [Candidatus Dormibacteraeota bacterium]
MTTTGDDGELRLGAGVYASDGSHVGSLHRALVDQNDFRLRALVVKESRSFSGHLLSPGSSLLVDDVLIPVEALASKSDDRIELNLDAAAIRQLPPYLHYRYTTPSGSEDLEHVGEALAGWPGVPSMAQEADKRADEIEIEAGEKVMARTPGQVLGEVESVLFEHGALVGVALKPAGWFKAPVILPRRLLERGDDLALFARLEKDDLEQLQPFEPEPEG